MNQEKILKIAKGLGKFHLDDVLIISELPEKLVIKEIEHLLAEKVIGNIDNEAYLFLGYSVQNAAKSYRKKVVRNFSSPNLTFKGAAERFLKYHAKESCKPSTLVSYQSYLRNHLLPEFGSLKLSAITSTLIGDFKVNKQDAGFAERSIKHMLTVLGGILELAVFDGAIISNPVSLVKWPRIPRKRVRYLNKEEIAQVLTVAKVSYPEFYPLIYTAIYTGLTRSELLGLTWDKIDFKNKIIRVDQTLYKRQIIPQTMPERIRNVDMPENLIQVLSKWKLDCPKGKIRYVFPNIKGEIPCPDNMIHRRFNPVISKAGVSKIVFNDLRDTYAVRLLQNKYPVEYVNKQMGFSSMVVTMDRYKQFLGVKTNKKARQEGDDIYN